MRISFSTGSANDTNTGSTFAGGFTYRIRPPRPVQRSPICPHQLLSLPCSASRVEARSAYRRLAKIAHPDLAPPERREELGRWMMVLNRLYELLEAV